MRDVELKCNRCGYETLATEGCYHPKCRNCGGTREVVKVHDHVLTWAETQAAGFSIAPGKMPSGSASD